MGFLKDIFTIFCRVATSLGSITDSDFGTCGHNSDNEMYNSGNNNY